jgi:hypothetical protein
MTPATRGVANPHTAGAFRGAMMRSIVRGTAGPRRYPSNGGRRTTPEGDAGHSVVQSPLGH